MQAESFRRQTLKGGALLEVKQGTEAKVRIFWGLSSSVCLVTETLEFRAPCTNMQKAEI